MTKLIRDDLNAMVRDAQAAGRLTREAASAAPIKAGPVTMPPKLVAQAQAAAQALMASDDYQDLKARMARGEVNAHELLDWLGRAMAGPHIAPFVTAVRETPELFSLDEFVPKAVSLGLMGEIDVVVIGGTGSFGYVQNFDPGNFDPKYYLGGTVELGLDLGFQGDIVLGFWTQETDDIGGNYVGAEVDIDDGGGGSVLGFEQDESPAILFVAAGIGIIDGADIDDMYVFTDDIGMPPVYQSGDGTYYLQIMTLECEDSYSNWDEVMIEFTVDGDATTYQFPGWKGYSMSESQRDNAITSWDVGAVIKFDTKAEITLNISALGSNPSPSVTFSTSDFSGLNSTCSKTFDEKYDVFNEVKYTMTAVLVKN